MSHIVTIKTEIRDAEAIAAAARRLRLADPVFGKAKLFSGAKTGWQVQLPDWTYPVVIDVNTGQVDYDNFEGRWGDPSQLSRFLQTYAVEKVRIEARRAGNTVTQTQLSDGSIRLTIQVAGGAQ